MIVDGIARRHAGSEEMLDAILDWVRLDSPTDDKRAVDALVDRVLTDAEAAGLATERIPQSEFGDFAVVRSGSPDAPHTLLLGHLDTVWPRGALPIRLEGDKAYGPGIYDMKAGVYLALTALANRQRRAPDGPGITLLLTTDEEVGSPVSRDIIHSEASRHNQVLVFEPGIPGTIKVSRNGSARYWIIANGRAAHSGVDHARGRSAIAELARVVTHLEAQTDYELGTTFNVGVISGGTRANVVPEHAKAHLDVRVRTVAEADRVVALMENLQSSANGVSLKVEGRLTRPPYEAALATTLFKHAALAGVDAGYPVRAIHSNGGSDANLTAATGTPTLDGLGADGDGAHAEHEHITVSSLAPRLALIEELLERLTD